jgi:hypothetical protein
MVVLRRVPICQSTITSGHPPVGLYFVSGPLISPAAKKRVVGLIDSAEIQGGKIHLDGRGLQVAGYSDGNFVGPTIIEAGTSMRCYQYVTKLPGRLTTLNFDIHSHVQGRDFWTRVDRHTSRYAR